MTVSAPAARAFVTSPENLIPPSAMTGIPCLFATLALSWMAVIWGTPTPAMTRVVQIDPGPTPIFTPWTPVGAAPYGRPHAQAAQLVFAGIGILNGLFDVLDGDEAFQVILLVHDQKL